LDGLKSHPTVGDVRGKGLMWGVEFVRDKGTREPIDPKLMFFLQLAHEAMERGLFIETSTGSDRGQRGDMVMFAPAYISTQQQVDEMVEVFDQTLTAVEQKNGF
jgi:adenosylmethionine-8-amino-7-oxononanoate aminotransferase